MTTTRIRTTSCTPPRALMVVAASAVVLTACSSSGSSSTSAAQAQLSKIRAATSQAAGSTPAAPTGPTIDLAGLDACSLLTPADANAAGHAAEFDGLQDAATVYTLTVTKGSGAYPSCTFAVADDTEQGTVTVHVEPGTYFHVRPYDTPTTGLGDEAYDDGNGPVVRVGNVEITGTDNSFPDSMTVALVRRIIPKLTK